MNDFALLVHANGRMCAQKHSFLFVQGSVRASISRLLPSMVKHAHVVRVSTLYGGVEWNLLHKSDVVSFGVANGCNAVGVFLGLKCTLYIFDVLQSIDFRNDCARLLEELTGGAHLRAFLLRLSGTSKVAELAALAPLGIYSLTTKENV